MAWELIRMLKLATAMPAKISRYDWLLFAAFAALLLQNKDNVKS